MNGGKHVLHQVCMQLGDAAHDILHTRMLMPAGHVSVTLAHPAEPAKIFTATQRCTQAPTPTSNIPAAPGATTSSAAKDSLACK